MPLPPGWQDNGAALFGPTAPDGHQYFFSDASGMRTLAKQLLASGTLAANDVPLENAVARTPNRIEQCTTYHCLVIARDDAKSAWGGFVSNLGAEHMAALGRVGTPAILPRLPDPPPISTSPKLRIIPCLNKYGVGISEFTPGDYLNTGRCNWASLAVALAATEGIDPSHDRMVMIANDAYARGYCTAKNKAARMDQVAAYARDIAQKHVSLEWDYQEPLQGDWWGVIEDHAGTLPIVLQVANGSALADAQTMVRDEAYPTLRYHTIMIAGMSGGTPIVCDPDHPEATRRFQLYSRATLTAAVPCGLLMLAIP